MTSKANKVPLFCHRFDRKIIKRYGKTNTISFERTSGRQKGTMGVEKKKKKKRGWEKRERNGAENVYAYLQSRLSSLGSRFEGASLHSADHKANIQREGDRREGRVDIVRGVYTLCFGPFWREPVSLRACILWTRQPPVHAREYNETKRNETALCLWSRVYGMAEGWSMVGATIYGRIIFRIGWPPPATITNIASHLRSCLQACTRMRVIHLPRN